MSASETPVRDDEWSLSVLPRLGRACRSFDAAWQAVAAAATRPKLEDYLERFGEPEHAVALRELLLVEIHQRRRLGENPQPGEYRARFPGLDPTWLAKALGTLPSGAERLATPSSSPDEPVLASLDPAAVRLRRRGRRLAAGVAAAVAAALVGLALYTWRSPEADQKERATGEPATRREQEAMAAFELARQAADDYFLKVGRDPRLLENPPLRQELLRAAVPYYEKLMTLPGEDLEVQAEVGRSCMQLAQLTRELGEPARALTLYEKAYGIFDRLAMADGPKGPKVVYVTNKGKCQIMLALLNREAGRLEAAQRLLEDADLQLGWAMANSPDGADSRSEQAMILDNLARIFLAKGDTDEALKACRDGLRLRRSLYEQHPDVTESLRDLIASQDLLGVVCLRRGDTAEAGQAFQEALRLGQHLVEQNPGVGTYQSELASRHDSLGALYRDLHKWEEAEQAFQNALEIRQRLCGEHPDVSRYRGELAWSYHKLAGVSALAGVAVAADTRLPQAERNQRAEHYATRAVALLRQAAAKGYNDLDALQGDKDLDPLRERADFKQLRAELEAKRKTESK